MPEKWDEEDESSTPPSSPPTTAVGAIPRRGKFDDEESEDSDVLDSWDAAEDSEVEREKERLAAEKKSKAAAEAAACKKPKAQRIAEHSAANKQRQLDNDSEESSEDESEKRERLRRTELEADLEHAEDLFGSVGISNNRKAITAANAVVVDVNDPTVTIDLASLPLFHPKTKPQFETLREALIPVISENSQKAHYVLFLQEFTKRLAKDLPSDQIKKIASGLTALSNEKMKEEKLANKGGKRSKPAKVSVVADRVVAARGAKDVKSYNETLEDGYFSM